MEEIIQDQIRRSASDYKPSARKNMDAAFRELVQNVKTGVRIAVPAVIYDYDRKTRVAQVIPLIKFVYKGDGIQYVRRKTFSVTAQNISHGGFTFDIPLFKGDTGWVISSDWNTELIKQEGVLQSAVLQKDRPATALEDEYPSQPNTFEIHSLTDGVFIPDCWGKLELERVKDLEGGVGSMEDDAVYFGTSLYTDDEYQEGTKWYTEHESCSISMHQDGEMRIAQSKKAEDVNRVIAKFKNGDLEIKQKTKDKGDTVVKIENGDVSVETEKNSKVDIKTDKGDISAETTSGDVNIKSSSADINITAGKNVSITAGTQISLTAPVISFNGHVVLGSDVNMLGKQVAEGNLPEPIEHYYYGT